MRQDERMITIPLREGSGLGAGAALEGVFQAGQREAERGSLFAAPHPLYGGSMDSPVVNELAWASASVGLPSVRFNWRGVGASAGAPSGEAHDADADYTAALAYVAETVSGGVVAGGYSFGAVTALRAARTHPRIERLLLVAPPPSMLPDAAFELGKPMLVMVGENDDLASASELEKATAGRPGVRFETIADADHFFVAGLAQLASFARDWLEDA